MVDRVSGPGGSESGYSIGEVMALVAPLLGCEPGQLNDLVIVGVLDDGPAIASSRPDDGLRFSAYVLAKTLASILDGDIEL